MATNTATRIRDPYNTPPISPKLAGTTRRVCTSNKKDHSEINAQAMMAKIENTRPPL